jgi:hypothetical protein
MNLFILTKVVGSTVTNPRVADHWRNVYAFDQFYPLYHLCVAHFVGSAPQSRIRLGLNSVSAIFGLNAQNRRRREGYLV